MIAIVAAAADSMIAAVVMTIDGEVNEAAMTAATMTVEAVAVVSIDATIAAVMIVGMTIAVVVAVTTEGMRTETEAMEDMDGIRGRQGKNISSSYYPFNTAHISDAIKLIYFDFIWTIKHILN